MARGFGKLTAKKVEHLSTRGMHTDGGGLYLQVAKGGSKSWLFRYKLYGRTHWHGLGSLRDVSLEEARDKATEARKVRRNGADPIQAKREAEAAARIEAAKAITFGAAAKRFIKANRAGWRNSKHADQWNMTLLGIAPNGKPAKNDYCKTIRDLPVGAIDTTLVLRIIEPIWSTKTETASRIRSRFEQVIDACKAKGEFRGENPARWKGHLDNLLPATSKVRNHPALPYRQLPAFMREVRERGGVAAAALEFQNPDCREARQCCGGEVGSGRSQACGLDYSGRPHEEGCRARGAVKQGCPRGSGSHGSSQRWERVHLPQHQGQASE
jgi:hypothetical protein